MTCAQSIGTSSDLSKVFSSLPDSQVPVCPAPGEGAGVGGMVGRGGPSFVIRQQERGNGGVGVKGGIAWSQEGILCPHE